MDTRVQAFKFLRKNMRSWPTPHNIRYCPSPRGWWWQLSAVREVILVPLSVGVAPVTQKQFNAFLRESERKTLKIIGVVLAATMLVITVAELAVLGWGMSI